MTTTRSELKQQYYDRRAAAEFRGQSIMSVRRDEWNGLLTPLRFKKGGKIYYAAAEVEQPPSDDIRLRSAAPPRRARHRIKRVRLLKRLAPSPSQRGAH